MAIEANTPTIEVLSAAKVEAEVSNSGMAIERRAVPMVEVLRNGEFVELFDHLTPDDIAVMMPRELMLITMRAGLTARNLPLAIAMATQVAPYVHAKPKDDGGRGRGNGTADDALDDLARLLDERRMRLVRRTEG